MKDSQMEFAHPVQQLNSSKSFGQIELLSWQQHCKKGNWGIAPEHLS